MTDEELELAALAAIRAAHRQDAAELTRLIHRAGVSGALGSLFLDVLTFAEDALGDVAAQRGISVEDLITELEMETMGRKGATGE